MEDRFKFRAWSDEYNRYLDKYDIYDETLATDYSIYTLLEFYVDSNKFTFEQCTGLKDKNGKLIYEGDILKIHLSIDEKVYVSYNDDRFELNGEYGFRSPLRLYKNDCEVVGNINENPELLEEK